MVQQQSLESLAIELGQILVSRSWRIATAESCTGGGLANAITAIPGCSQWFEQGFITYSNRSKEEQLGVKANLLKQDGAVSGSVAVAMAEGVISRTQVDVAIAITGIAGPSGGSEEKPVGTVWIAWSIRGNKTFSHMFQLGEGRQRVRERAVLEAFNGLLMLLKKNTV